MCAHRRYDIMPADAHVSSDFVHTLANLVGSEGEQLEVVFTSSGIIRGTKHVGNWYVDLDRIHDFLSRHCAAMVGHLPRTYWPRFRKSSLQPDPTFLCTCKWFVQHAACEHVYFVAAIRGEGPSTFISHPPALGTTPQVRKTGRKRKA